MRPIGRADTSEYFLCPIRLKCPICPIEVRNINNSVSTLVSRSAVGWSTITASRQGA